MFLQRTLIIISTLMLLSPQALGSSLPQAETKLTGISIGSGPSFSIDVPLNKSSFVSAAVGLPLFFGDVGYVRYSLTGAVRLADTDLLTVALLGGVFGDLDPQQRSDLGFSPLGFSAGIGLTYHIDENMAVRGVLTPGIGIPSNTGGALFSPNGGVEFVYHIDHLSVTLGFNGFGDIVGMSYRFQ